MQVQRVFSPAKYLYHYTTRENAQQIIREHRYDAFRIDLPFLQQPMGML